MYLDNISKNTLPIKTVLLALFMLLVPLPVSAECQWSSGATALTGTINVRRPDITYTPGGTEYTFANSVPFSPSGFGVDNWFSDILTCDSGELLMRSVGSYPLISVDGQYLLRTNIEGVYLRVDNMYWTFPEPGGGANSAEIFENKITPNFLLTNDYGHLTPSLRFQLVIPNPIKSGGVIEGGIFIQMHTSDGKPILNLIMPSITLHVATCEISEPYREIDMGRYEAHHFPGVGSVGAIQPFTIQMECPTSSMKPTITFSGEVDTHAPTVFSNQGSAANVGIQLLKNDSVIEPDAAISLGNSLTGSNIFPFGVRLYRLNGVISSGTIDIPVTFTLNYE